MEILEIGFVHEKQNIDPHFNIKNVKLNTDFI